MKYGVDYTQSLHGRIDDEDVDIQMCPVLILFYFYIRANQLEIIRKRAYEMKTDVTKRTLNPLRKFKSEI